MPETETKRACGDCTACCKTHSVENVTDSGAWCGYCTVGKGCRIYATRPESCKTFECLWLQGFGPDDARPDRSKLVIDDKLDPGPFGVKRFPRMYEVTEGALKSAYAERVRTHMVKVLGVPLCEVPLRGDCTVYLPITMRPTPGIMVLVGHRLANVKHL